METGRMSEQEINGNVGRDQYNISGDKPKLQVDNRMSVGSNRKLIVEIIVGVSVAVVAGFLLFLFRWN